MLGGLFIAPVYNSPDRYRHVDLAAEHVVPVGTMVDYLIHGQIHKIHPRVKNNRAHARHGRADSGAGHRRLGNRGVYHSLGTKPGNKPKRCCPNTPGAFHPLTDDKDPGIRGQ